MLKERGLVFSFGSLRHFFKRHAITRKKTAHVAEQDRPDTVRPGPRRTWHGATALPSRRAAEGRRALSQACGPRHRCPLRTRLTDQPHRPFETYVEKALSTGLRPGDDVIMDNLSSHKGLEVRKMIEATAAPSSYSCRPTVPTSILSKTPLPSSRHICEKPPSQQSTVSGTLSADSPIASTQTSARTASPPKVTMQHDRIPL